MGVNEENGETKLVINSGTSAQTENYCFDRHHGLKNKFDDERAKKTSAVKNVAESGCDRGLEAKS